jgi:hypothetical protein
MNKLLTKIVNDSKLQKVILGTGFTLATLSNLLIYVGVYYSALKKGVELRDEYYESEENTYEQDSEARS